MKSTISIKVQVSAREPNGTLRVGKQQLLIRSKSYGLHGVIILCPQWGQEHLSPKVFLSKVREAGYDGIYTWTPEEKRIKKKIHSIRQGL
ncbi:MAG: hypothetical protein WKI04_15755 [Ferruginibacter sp.]